MAQYGSSPEADDTEDGHLHRAPPDLLGLVAPHQADEALGGQGPAGGEQQHAQQPAQDGRTGRADRCAVPSHFQRAEDLEPQNWTFHDSCPKPPPARPTLLRSAIR